MAGMAAGDRSTEVEIIEEFQLIENIVRVLEIYRSRNY